MMQIPASAGEYESSMKESAQTKEHAVLLKALVIVSVQFTVLMR